MIIADTSGTTLTPGEDRARDGVGLAGGVGVIARARGVDRSREMSYVRRCHTFDDGHPPEGVTRLAGEQGDPLIKSELFRAKSSRPNWMVAILPSGMALDQDLPSDASTTRQTRAFSVSDWQCPRMPASVQPASTRRSPMELDSPAVDASDRR